MGDALHRLQAPGGAPVSEPRSGPRSRVGSSTNGLSRSPAGQRSLAARACAVGRAAVRRARGGSVADQLTKQLVVEPARARRRGARRRPVPDPPRPELGIAFGLFSSATPIVTVLTAARGRLDARSSSRAPARASGAAGRARAPDRRQRLEPRRPRPPRARHRLPRLPLLARVQPRRHASSSSAWRSCSSPSLDAPTGAARPPRAAEPRRSASRPTRRARGSTASSPGCRGRLARGGGAAVAAGACASTGRRARRATG